MKYLLCVDSFKGSLTSMEAGNAIADGINEMVVVETTLLTEKGASFEQAVTAAERHILGTPDEFIMAIDI